MLTIGQEKKAAILSKIIPFYSVMSQYKIHALGRRKKVMALKQRFLHKFSLLVKKYNSLKILRLFDWSFASKAIGVILLLMMTYKRLRFSSTLQMSSDWPGSRNKHVPGVIEFRWLDCGATFISNIINSQYKLARFYLLMANIAEWC